MLGFWRQRCVTSFFCGNIIHLVSKKEIEMSSNNHDASIQRGTNQANLGQPCSPQQPGQTHDSWATQKSAYDHTVNQQKNK
jgi:hypothetical protein